MTKEMEEMYITIIHKETAPDFFLNLREHTSFENWFTQEEPAELIREEKE